MPAVHDGNCPAVEFVVERSCYLGEDIYLAYPGDREHELGHAYDRHMLNDGERRAIARVFRWSRWNKERFANWYDGCRRRANPRSIYEEWIYYPFRSVERIARRCAMIARAGS